MRGIEPLTSSLPRMRSTPELHRLDPFGRSGRRDSNSRHSAWKADALPTELLPLARLIVGVIGFEPIQSETTDLQSAPALQLRRTPVKSLRPFTRVSGGKPMSRWRDSNPRPADYKSAALAN